jgi:hypothetical protein
MSAATSLGPLGSPTPDDSEVEALYAAAHHLVLRGDLPEAKLVLTHICDLRPKALRYLNALAQVHRELGDLAGAATLFDYIDQLEPGRVSHLLDLVDCWLQIRSPQAQVAAQELLCMTINYAQLTQQYGPDLDRAQALVKLLSDQSPELVGVVEATDGQRTA